MDQDKVMDDRGPRTEPAGERARISVCLVNWNTRDYLAECLSSLYSTADGLCIEVIVVDNASSDGSPEMVELEFPQVHLIRNPDNPGFAAATNRALRLKTAQYALLLNPDITVCREALQELCRFMDETPDAGAASGKLLGSDGSFQYYYYRRDHCLIGWLLETANRMTWNLAPAFMDRLTYARFDPNLVTELEMLPGGCLLVRDEVLKEAGMLDEDFFLLHEDDEWSRRIRQAGWKLYFCPAARFQHQGGTSFESWSGARRAGQSLASRLLFLDKHYAKTPMLLARFAFVATFGLHLGAFLVARALGFSRSQRAHSAVDRLRWIGIVVTRSARLRRKAV